jgi:hypothetical protein
MLDTQKVERAIEQSSFAQRGRLPQVSCPSDVRQEQGSTFDCTAFVNRAGTRFVVTQLDDDGNVHYEAP